MDQLHGPVIRRAFLRGDQQLRGGFVLTHADDLRIDHVRILPHLVRGVHKRRLRRARLISGRQFRAATVRLQRLRIRAGLRPVHHDEHRGVLAAAEALFEHLRGLALRGSDVRRLIRGQRELQVQHRDRESSQHHHHQGEHEAGHAVHQLHPAHAESVLLLLRRHGTGLGVVRAGSLLLEHPVPEHAQQGGQEGQGHQHGDEDIRRGRVAHICQEGDVRQAQRHQRDNHRETRENHRRARGTGRQTDRI